MAGKSEAIWINNRNRSSRNSTSSDGPFSPPGYSSSFGRGNLFGIQRSMSVASDGTAQNSPTFYSNDSYEPSFGGRQRTRTYSFSGNSDDDPWSSPLSNSAPGSQWRRSNSVSYGADKSLGRIDEHSSGKMSFGGFGDTIKKSMDKLFHPGSQNGSFGAKQPFLTGGGDKMRKNGQVKDQVVSMLCDGALR